MGIKINFVIAYRRGLVGYSRSKTLEDTEKAPRTLSGAPALQGRPNAL